MERSGWVVRASGGIFPGLREMNRYWGGDSRREFSLLKLGIAPTLSNAYALPGSLGHPTTTNSLTLNSSAVPGPLINSVP